MLPRRRPLCNLTRQRGLPTAASTASTPSVSSDPSCSKTNQPRRVPCFRSVCRGRRHAPPLCRPSLPRKYVSPAAAPFVTRRASEASPPPPFSGFLFPLPLFPLIPPVPKPITTQPRNRRAPRPATRLACPPSSFSCVLSASLPPVISRYPNRPASSPPSPRSRLNLPPPLLHFSFIFPLCSLCSLWFTSPFFFRLPHRPLSPFPSFVLPRPFRQSPRHPNRPASSSPPRPSASPRAPSLIAPFLFPLSSVNSVLSVAHLSLFFPLLPDLPPA